MSYNNILYNAVNFRYHGNYCGPGWSAGKYQDSVIDKDVPPVDELDAICMEHDAQYYKAKKWEARGNKRLADVRRVRADREFVKKAKQLGIKANIAALFINAQASVAESFTNLQQDDNMPRKYLRTDDEEGKVPTVNVITPDRPERSAKREGARMRDFPKLENESIEEETSDQKGMEDDGGASMVAQFASFNSGGSKGYKETPISYNPTLTYGLQETHTTIIPFTTYCTVLNNSIVNPIKLDFRLTGPYNPRIHLLQSPVITGGPDRWVYATGIFSKATYVNDGLQQTGNIGQQPDYVNVDNTPAWINYWTKFYDYYTVLSCEWEITIQNTAQITGCDGIVGYTYQSGTNLITDTVTMKNMQQMKGIRWEQMKSYSSSNAAKDHYKVIRGIYYPGQERRNVVNDNDVRTWSEVTTNPTLDERLSLWFFKSPMHATTPAQFPTLNVQASFKYIVQFKDLKYQARFPTANLTGNPSITATLPTDALM